MNKVLTHDYEIIISKKDKLNTNEVNKIAVDLKKILNTTNKKAGYRIISMANGLKIVRDNLKSVLKSKGSKKSIPDNLKQFAHDTENLLKGIKNDQKNGLKYCVMAITPDYQKELYGVLDSRYEKQLIDEELGQSV